MRVNGINGVFNQEGSNVWFPFFQDTMQSKIDV